jgi:hypothetical protein
MPRSIAAAIVLALALIIVSSTSASACWWFYCDDEQIYEPPPVYVYDHNSGPTWTGNGWAYLPIGQYRPRPEVYMPPPPPPGYLRPMSPDPHSGHGGLRRLLPF